MGEHSHPMDPDRVATFTSKELTPNADSLNTRQWTARASALAAPLLPPDSSRPLTTDQLAKNGHPINVFQHFHFDPADADDLFSNYEGLSETADVVSPDPTLDDSGHLVRNPWPGFVETEVPVGDTALFARISPPAKGNDTYIVITHGLFGSLDGSDMLNQVNALRHAGFGVLALEMRGHGETQVRHPDAILTFGIRECSDLLTAARWLKSEHHAQRVGLITFSLTGYQALLAAWLDGVHPVTQFKDVPPLANLPTPEPQPAFNAGIIVVSAPVDILQTADLFETQYNLLDGPIKYNFQQRVEERCALYHEPATYSMWGLLEHEYTRAGWDQRFGSFQQFKPEFRTFLDFKGPAHLGETAWQEGVRRMENVRVPLLVLHTVNDPLGTAQGVADLFSRVKNPNIGCIILKRGGHTAITAYATDYYYSLLLNFFNPATAPTARAPSALAHAVTPSRP